MRSQLVNDQTSLIFYNFHNHDIVKSKFSLFSTSIHKDNEYCCDNNSFLFLGGDFNVAKLGNDDIDQHFPLASTVPRKNYGSFAQSINDLFSFLTEVDINEPTHFTKSTGKLSFIDRAAFSSPSWTLPLFSVNSTIFARPCTLSNLDLSDHGIFVFSFSKNSSQDPKSRPISPDILKTPYFNKWYLFTLHNTNWALIPPCQQI